MSEVKLNRLPDRTPVTLFANMIIGTTWLSSAHAVGVIVNGGGTVPVDGTEEEVLNQIRMARSAPLNQGEIVNGISKRKSRNNKRPSKAHKP